MLIESAEELAARVERVTRERAAQGLPTPATDPHALALTARVLREAATETAA